MDITATGTRYRSTDGTGPRGSARRTRGGHLHASPRSTAGTRRGLSAAEIAIIVTLVVAVVLAALVSGARQSARPARLTSVKVEAGQSLWSIASAHPIQGLTTEQTVDEIKRSNRLADYAVAAGTVLRIPAADQPDVALAR